MILAALLRIAFAGTAVDDHARSHFWGWSKLDGALVPDLIGREIVLSPDRAADVWDEDRQRRDWGGIPGEFVGSVTAPFSVHGPITDLGSPAPDDLEVRVTAEGAVSVDEEPSGAAVAAWRVDDRIFVWVDEGGRVGLATGRTRVGGRLRRLSVATAEVEIGSLAEEVAADSVALTVDQFTNGPMLLNLHLRAASDAQGIVVALLIQEFTDDDETRLEVHAYAARIRVASGEAIWPAGSHRATTDLVAGLPPLIVDAP